MTARHHQPANTNTRNLLSQSPTQCTATNYSPTKPTIHLISAHLLTNLSIITLIQHYQHVIPTHYISYYTIHRKFITMSASNQFLKLEWMKERAIQKSILYIWMLILINLIGNACNHKNSNIIHHHSTYFSNFLQKQQSLQIRTKGANPNMNFFRKAKG